MTATRASVKDKWGKETRWYSTPDGKFPSVTSVLSVIAKPALVAWSAKVEREMVLEVAGRVYESFRDQAYMSGMHPTAFFESTVLEALGKEKAHAKVLEKAGNIGTEAHALCEYHNVERMGGDPGPKPAVSSPEAKNAFYAYKEWADSVNLKLTAIERFCWSANHRYAGGLDWRGEVNGVDVLGDIKTGKAVYQEAHFQVAAYAHAEAEMGHGMAVKGLIVRLPKAVGDPAFEVVEVPDLKASLKPFLAALNLWRCLNPEKE